MFCPGLVLTTKLLGQVMVGSVTSLTVTVKVHWAVRSARSVAVYRTVVMPMEKLAPRTGELVTALTPWLSLAVGSVQDTAKDGPVEGALTCTLAGQAMAGGAMSLTLTVNVQLAVLPAASVAVLVTYTEQSVIECRHKETKQLHTVVVVPTANVLLAALLWVMVGSA